jgi:peptide/nickel transport system permease protein
MNKKLLIGMLTFLVILLISTIYPRISEKDPLEMEGMMFEPPSAEHVLGTDNFGRDIMTELIFGTETSIAIGFIAGIIATIIGTAVGVVGGYLGGNVDNLLNTITNIFLVIPPILILIVISVSLQSRSLVLMSLILSITSWPWTARALRAQTQSIRSREHIKMAKLNGENSGRIIVFEVLPYLISYIVMAFILQVSSGILNEAAMSMLGLGPTDAVSLGTMLQWALLFESARVGAWWAFIPPAAIITAITFSLYLANSGMDEIVNPRLRGMNA